LRLLHLRGIQNYRFLRGFHGFSGQGLGFFLNLFLHRSLRLHRRFTLGSRFCLL
jgi:hypothetical protein